MKDKVILLFTILSLVMLAGCGDHRNQLKTGYGDVEICCSVDTALTNVAEAGTVAVPVPDIEDFKITAKGIDNGYLKTWRSVQEFENSQKKLPVGRYVFTAVTGVAEDGFGGISFGAECEVQVADGCLTEIPLVCRISGTLVSSTVSADLAARFREIVLRIKSVEGGYVNFSAAEKRAAYIRSGRIKGELAITDKSGRTVSLQPIEIDAKAGEHYEVRMNEADKDGEPALEIRFDEASLAEPVRIPLGDELFSGQMPVFSVYGFSEDHPVSQMESVRPSQPVGCKLAVPGGLEKLNLTVVSATLDDEQWSEERNLVGMDAEVLSECGISVDGNTKGSVSATVDFTDFIPKLPAGNAGAVAHRLVLQAEDAFGRLASHPVELEVVTEPVKLTLALPQTIGLGETEAEVFLSYNGDRMVENVRFLTEIDGSGIWEEKIPLSAEKTQDGVFKVVIPVPAGDCDVDVRASYKDGLRVSNVVSLNRSVPEFAVSCEARNVWPSKADLMIRCDEPIVEYLSVIVKESGGEWHPAVVERVPEENRITVSTLMPDKDYSLSVSAGDRTQTLEIHTEKALELENASFEDNKRTIHIPEILCGGKYSNLASWMPLYNSASIEVKEATGWTSVNAKTCSEHARTANTWFKVPTTEIVMKAYEGAYAVKLRNAAWDLNGVEPPRDARTDREYYSGNVPRMADRSAGKLFLGRYSFSADGKEYYDEGIPFYSRPTAVTGVYSYMQDRNDLNEKGLVTVRVIHEENGKKEVIGEGTGLLSPSTSYTRFTVPVSYSVRDKQATMLQLMVSSSCYASYDKEEETRRIKTTDYLEKGVSLGAELIVDDLELLYE